jgi:hypothetical protein
MKSTGRITIDLRRLMRDSYDRCRKCGEPLNRGTPAYAGYSEEGTPLYVGQCCAGAIAELATHVYWWWSADHRLEAETPLWRFMDFAKFVALLKDRALYFCRADHLGDRYEGARGVVSNKARWDEHYLNFFRKAIMNPPPGHACTLSNEEIEREANRLLSELKQAGEYELRQTYVSCWHENEVESEALWRLYCPPPSAGVAISTNYRRLNDSLEGSPQY